MLLSKERVVCGDKQGHCALSCHESRELGLVGIVANDYTECQLSHLEDGNLATSLINGTVDGRMQLAIDTGD